MAIQFQPVDIADSRLFGVKLTGTVGRSDKGHLLDLAGKCLLKGKLNVVLDVADLKAMGGGAAATFAAFQQQLVDAGGEAVFAGPGDVLQRFLAGKFADLPLRCFGTADEAAADYFASEKPAGKEKGKGSKAGKAAKGEATAARLEPEETTDFCSAVPDPTPGPNPVSEPDDGEDGAEAMAGFEDEVGAMGFFAEEFEIDDEEEATAAAGPSGGETAGEPTSGSDEPASATQAGNADSPSAASGRRKDHSYTSLSDAISALGGWSSAKDDGRFGKALENLLFSHGLAEEATLLALRDGHFTSDDGAWKIPVDGSVPRQLQERGQPLTLIDIQDDELSELERALLEETNPDILMPVRSEDHLGAILLLKRNAGEDEYSVVEHFALELLMRVLSGEDQVGNKPQSPQVAPEAVPRAEEAEDPGLGSPEDEPWRQNEARDDSIAEVLLRLALDLPDADDRPHFWRIFGRHLWPVLPISDLAFLTPEQRRPQVVIGNRDAWLGLDLGVKRLKVFFRTIERPVAVPNLPSFFKEVKEDLDGAGVEWVVSLNWDDEYLGTAILTLKKGFDAEGLADLIHELFTETSRLLSRFDGSRENADVNLELVRILMGQREKRMFGSDEMTRAMVAHVHRLARAMAFPPDQERDLIYGCLLRDVGLIDKEDGLMGTPEQMDPVQWSLYRRHPEEGAALLQGLNLPQTIVEVVRHHHERFSGEGFPLGLSGRGIPLAARVVTVVENYVAMVIGTEDRAPVTAQDAARIMRDNVGQRYDLDIVHLFLRAIMPDSKTRPEGVLASSRRVNSG